MAGVSFSTAGKILRGEDRFLAETVQRVQEAAARLGYRSNRAAALLAAARSRPAAQRSGLVLLNRRGVQDRTLARYRDRAQRYAQQLGYATRILELDEKADATVLEECEQAGIAGMLCLRLDPRELWPGADLSAFEFVLAGRTVQDIPFPCVRPDVIAAVRMCYERLQLAGCRRIGACLHRHRPRYLDDRDRLAAWLECWRSDHGDEPPPRVFERPMGDYRMIDRWLRGEACDGVLCFSVGDVLTLRNRGVRIPDDVRCACLVRSELSRSWIAGTDEQQDLLHEAAVALLDQRLRVRAHGRAPAADMVFPVSWHPGGSL